MELPEFTDKLFKAPMFRRPNKVLGNILVARVPDESVRPCDFAHVRRQSTSSLPAFALGVDCGKHVSNNYPWPASSKNSYANCLKNKEVKPGSSGSDSEIRSVTKSLEVEKKKSVQTKHASISFLLKKFLEHDESVNNDCDEVNIWMNSKPLELKSSSSDLRLAFSQPKTVPIKKATPNDVQNFQLKLVPGEVSLHKSIEEDVPAEASARRSRRNKRTQTSTSYLQEQRGVCPTCSHSANSKTRGSRLMPAAFRYPTRFNVTCGYEKINVTPGDSQRIPVQQPKLRSMSAPYLQGIDNLERPEYERYFRRASCQRTPNNQDNFYIPSNAF